MDDDKVASLAKPRSFYAVDQEKWEALFFDASLSLSEVIELALQRGVIFEDKSRLVN